ncbi:hypothetical protein [Cylindrospermum stagnale]|nr:hypothetical protein [Cylindrospermum stagnale]
MISRCKSDTYSASRTIYRNAIAQSALGGVGDRAERSAVGDRN